jgi:hypothetical protein
MDDNTATDDNAAMDVLSLYKKKKKERTKENRKNKNGDPGASPGMTDDKHSAILLPATR